MGVLEDTGTHIYVPTRETGVPPVLGERSDMRGDTGFDPLDRATNARGSWFLYGPPVNRWDFYLPRPELLGWGNLSAAHLLSFWRRSEEIGAGAQALAAAEMAMELANAAEEGRVTLFEASFSEWARLDRISELAGEIRRLLGAHHEDDIIRDDTLGDRDDAFSLHGTTVRLGFSGAIPLLLIERSKIGRQNGQDVLMRSVEAVKTSDPETALAVLNELSLVEEMRVRHLLAGATPEEKRYVLSRADRSTIQRDHDVQGLIEEFHYVPEAPRWRRAAQAIMGLPRRAADSRLIFAVDKLVAGRRRARNDL